MKYALVHKATGNIISDDLSLNDILNKIEHTNQDVHSFLAQELNSLSSTAYPIKIYVKHSTVVGNFKADDYMVYVKKIE